MFTILLHSSKTMKAIDTSQTSEIQPPLLKSKAKELVSYIRTLSLEQLQKSMHITPALAEKTARMYESWDDQAEGLPAIDCYLGDIYSGLQAQRFSEQDRAYANEHLYILSGLYGVVRALDTIQPYRLEMGYSLPEIKSLYAFWGDSIVKQLPGGRDVINVSAVEYTKAVLPHLEDSVKIITPKFYTISPKTGQPTFVTVHTKIARGAFARWVIQNTVEETADLKGFNELGYVYDASLSTADEPVFVAQTFQGIGLSVRLTT